MRSFHRSLAKKTTEALERWLDWSFIEISVLLYPFQQIRALAFQQLQPFCRVDRLAAGVFPELGDDQNPPGGLGVRVPDIQNVFVDAVMLSQKYVAIQAAIGALRPPLSLSERWKRIIENRFDVVDVFQAR